VATLMSLLWLHSSDSRIWPIAVASSSNEIVDVSKIRYYNSFLIKKYNSLDLMTEHRCSHDDSTWGRTCMHVASIIDSGHHCPSPPLVSATEHRSTAAPTRTPPPQSPSRLLSGCAHYLPNTPESPLARAHET
jgi:hypothetical protein